MFLSRTLRSRNLVLSFSPVDVSRLSVMLSFPPLFLLLLWTMPAILVPSRLLPHSRLTFMLLLRPMSYIPHLVHVSLQLIKSLILPPPIVRCCVLRDVLKKYSTILSWLSVFFFVVSSFLCHLGGIILISGVRICKVAISIVQYTRTGLLDAWVKEYRGMLVFELPRVNRGGRSYQLGTSSQSGS
jgi:hypothetical protein